VIRVYVAGNVIETHQHAGDFKEPVTFNNATFASLGVTPGT
jgi:hypothetical protein